MHSIIVIIAYRLNDQFMLSILLLNPKIITLMQQKLPPKTLKKYIHFIITKDPQCSETDF